MKIRYIFKTALPLLILFSTLGSCIKKPQDKIIGTWFFDKVVYHSGFLDNDNITRDYIDLRLEFRSDGTFSRINVANNTTINGSWKIDGHDVTNGETTTYVQTLVLSTYDATTGQGEIHIWNDFSVKKNVMRGTENSGNDSYSYVMRK